MASASRYSEDTTPTKRLRVDDVRDGGVGTPPQSKDKEAVLVRWLDKGPLLVLGDDGVTVSGTKGFCMARTNVGVKKGTYYFEIKLLPAAEAYHVRVGWGTKKGDINAPVGFDEHSYGYRDIGGETTHKSKRSDRYGESFGVGDIVGTLICVNWEAGEKKAEGATPSPLPGRFAPSSLSKQSSDLVAVSSPRRVDDASYIRFFVNGRDQGMAFEGMPFAEYFPCVSIYGPGTVRANFGPDFECAPPGVVAVPPPVE
ncbi:hypothetical protein H310_00272 [Aphanomyces invadans]|uniref:B30.2/SPRY domain-containing protein n=1 Tax=Aphanomyces invadans TaxID=157072 RepID=A0A024UV37_9STRA|nr:hypothetical protein H310_00272 [Aphanomyces invadans]ETW09792.1 hypothetical protein H310_00272 [Aphanomyces invadans]|eukprot:XP_008861203.1 hypothetical protein H310_00272 [Aphanomyces invadans]